MRRHVVLGFAATLFFSASMLRADPLSDFKDALAQTGRASIPYSDLRGSCRSEQSNVHDYCDGKRGPVSCGSESITRQLKDNIEKEKRTVDAMKDKKRSLEDHRSQATDDNEKSRLSKEIDQAERDIYEAGKRVDQAIADLETRKRLVDDAIYTLHKCIDYRRAVMNIFGAALDWGGHPLP